MNRKIDKNADTSIEMPTAHSSLAFTLAEVLITLGIIGVVAAMAIPTLINKTNEAEFNTGLKKAYSVLSNAVTMIIANNGAVNVGTASSTDSVMRSEFCNVMNCSKQDTTSNIFGPSNYKYYKNSSPSNWPGTGVNNAAAILNDGMFLQFWTGTDCTSGGTVNACAYIYVDVNGTKNPNMQGKDLFVFWITYKNGGYSVLPVGTSGDTKTCTVGATSWGTGDGCTAQRLTNPDNMP